MKAAIVEMSVRLRKLRKGDKGDPGVPGKNGAPGLIYRKTEYAIGREYRNDTALLGTQPLCYLDIVFQTGTDGQLVGAWTCKKTHVSTVATRPETTASTEYWELCNIFADPIYTPLIMAQGAVIAFMQGNQLKIFDTMGNLKAGISASGGASPIIYANPQRYPVSATVALYSSTSTAQNQIGATWGISRTVAAGAYLHLRFTVTHCDGTRTVSYHWGAWRNASSAPVSVNAPSVDYRASGSPTDCGTGKVCAAPCTNAASPHLWARAHINLLQSTGWLCIAQQVGGDDPVHAMYQQFDSGSASYGMPSGARILLNAAPSDGLPRIDIFDEGGNPAAHFDGSWVASSADLYGSGAASATIAADPPLQASADPMLADLQHVTASREITLTCASAATITIPAGAIRLYGRSGSLPSAAMVGTQMASGKIMVDGSVVASADLIFDAPGQSIDAADAQIASFQEHRVAVAKGTHKIRIAAEFTGYRGGYASMRLGEDLPCTIAEGRLMARYFANGIAIGTAADNYFMAWNDGASMQFIIENPTAGLRVTSAKAQVKRNGAWVDL